MRCCACRASPACRPPSTKIGIRSGTPCRPADFASRSSIVGIARWDWPPANDCAPFICRPMCNLDRCARLRYSSPPFFITALGIVGTGLLAIPVLAGSAAYALAEARRWKIGLARKPQEAKAFYATIVVATLVGTGISFSSIAPIKALFWSAVINGVVAAPVMTVMMLMTANKSIMGRFEIHGYLKYVGWIATAVMAAASTVMFISAFIGGST